MFVSCSEIYEDALYSVLDKRKLRNLVGNQEMIVKKLFDNVNLTQERGLR